MLVSRAVTAPRSDGARRREEILDAALFVFGREGALGAGVEAIRKKASASPSSVYHLFGGLDAITLALLERTFARLFGHLAERVTPTKTAKTCVEALVLGHLDWVLANRVEAKVMYELMTLEMSAKVQKPLARKKAALLAPVVEHFGGFIAAGKLPAWSPLELDLVLLGVAHESCRRFLGGAPITVEWMRTELPRLAWQSVATAR
jgi:AcrR family transcriptional regulator